MTVRILTGDCRDVLRTLPECSVQAIVTSPPYWNLRDYGVDGQIGLEASVDEWVAEMVDVFREARRVLADDGVAWVNLGDSYAGSWGAQSREHAGKHAPNVSALSANQVKAAQIRESGTGSLSRTPGLKQKDLIGQPWRVAFALQADGWYWRDTVVWHKCLSGGAWLYARTQKGEMPVMLKDLVRLNPESVQLWNGSKWTQVVSWSRSESHTEKIEIVLRSGERVGCTGDHRWPTGRGVIEARDLRVGDCLAHAHLPDSPLQAPGYLTDDVAWLAGLYLAEGSRADDTVQLSLHADELHWLARIESAAAQLGATMTHTLKGNTLNVRLYGRVLRAAIESVVGGRVALDKHLRAEVWRLPNRTLRAIACGYLDGDGHVDPRSERIRLGLCRNYALERDLRTLAARLGATITLKPTTVRYQGGERPAFRGEWRWTRNGHHNERDRGEIAEIRNSRARQFWDVTVADEPHLFALSSGLLTHNSNPMPESVRDRCTKAWEPVLMMTKAGRYYFDADAIAEPASPDTHARYARGRSDSHKYADGGPGGQTIARSFAHMVGVGNKKRPRKGAPNGSGTKNNESFDAAMAVMPERRNKRNVWTIASEPFSEAHFATFPTALVEPCILASTRPGDTVLDCFGGAGTTGLMADRLQRDAVLIELNPQYADMARRRIHGDAPLFAEVERG